LIIKFPDFKWVNVILERLGHISYSLYLIHPIVYWFLAKYFKGAENTFLFLSLAISITLVLSNAVYVYFEKRFIDYGRKYTISNISSTSKLNFKYLLIIISTAILILQLNKRNLQLETKEKQQVMMLNTGTEYSKLLTQRSVFSDSIYKIFIAKIDGKKEIIFLKIGTLTEMQRQSKFFVHLYPKYKKDLLGKANHNPINFDANFTSFDYDGQLYNVAHTKLPDYEIEKLNLGQFGYNGNNDVNYKISHLIDGKKVATILKENKETIENFKEIEKSF
jgi:hypothetical protein